MNTTDSLNLTDHKLFKQDGVQMQSSQHFIEVRYLDSSLIPFDRKVSNLVESFFLCVCV